jgi:hypothetical protein
VVSGRFEKGRRYMNPIKVYEILEQQGFSKDNAKALIEYMSERDTEAATKGDVKDLKSEIKNDIGNLEVRLSREMRDQTWKFVGGVALISTIFKLADVFIHLGGGLK